LVEALPLYWLPDSTFDGSIMSERVDLRQEFVASFIAAHLVLVYFAVTPTKIFRTDPLRVYRGGRRGSAPTPRVPEFNASHAAANRL
jgi:hypothetical protein